LWGEKKGKKGVQGKKRPPTAEKHGRGNQGNCKSGVKFIYKDKNFCGRQCQHHLGGKRPSIRR